MPNAEIVLFWVFAFLIIVSAGLVVWARNPIHSAMALVGCFFALAGTYALLWAHTIAVLQVLVYAGAIMVLFVFVIMLLSLTDADLVGGKVTLSRIVGGASAIALAVMMVLVLRNVHLVGAKPDPQTFGTLQQMGAIVYTQYLLPFEAVSLLLLVAIVGAVVVAKSRI
ncbi:MAG: NADH-quinone oxidoreductase subunit J [Myxococcaceae bacterium]